MPFHLEKGPVFATFDAMYEDEATLRRFLLRLWNEGAAALGTLGVITSETFDDKAHPLRANALGGARLDAMRRDWFGERPDGTSPTHWGEESGGTRQFRTGYWLHFFGNVRAIVAETLMRAAEVSLGVDRPEPVDLPATTVPDSGRHWPVEFFWKCGQPRFEGWVTWRDKAQGRTGQVTVVFCTPATPDEVLSSPGSGGVEAPPPGWQSKWQGMWVCSHQRHRQHLMITTAPTLMGEWLVPFDAVMFTEGVGPIGTWSPDFGSGGVPDAPKAFMRVGEP